MPSRISTLAIVDGVNLVEGLMQVREDVPVPVMVGGYINECSRAYKKYPIYAQQLPRLALVMARWQTESLQRDYLASKYSFFMGGVVGLRVVECSISAELLPSLHTYFSATTPEPELSVNERYGRQKAALMNFCERGAAGVCEVDMPFNDWAHEIGIDEDDVPAFKDGIHALVSIGEQAGKIRSEQYVKSVLAEHEKQW